MDVKITCPCCGIKFNIVVNDAGEYSLRRFDIDDASYTDKIDDAFYVDKIQSLGYEFGSEITRKEV